MINTMVRKNILFFLALIAALFTSGCASYNPIPDGYSGAKARIQDSAIEHSSKKADFFFVGAVNGHEIENSVMVTAHFNYGRGFLMEPKTIAREIPAQPTTLTIVGRTVYAAPILDLTNTVYRLKGDIQFTPGADKFYTVKGELGEEHSAVWIEEYNVGPVTGTKIELNGSAKIGIFDK